MNRAHLDDRLLKLHLCVVHGVAGALNEMAGELLPHLQKGLQRRFPNEAADLIGTAAGDAILEYANRPDQFDLARGVPLHGFLLFRAARNLSNLRQAETRRRLREAKYAETAALTTPDDRLLRLRRAQSVWRRMKDIAVRDAEVRAFLDWLDEKVNTAQLAERLGHSNLPPDQKRRAVKQFRDRVIRRVRRRVGRET